MRVFLSHSSRDKPLIRELTQHLPSHVRTWIDERALLIGDDIETSIRQSIGREVDLVLIFIGRDSVASEWVRKELTWSLEREAELGRTFVLPVVLDEQAWQLVEPVAFRRRKYVKCTDYSEPGVKATAEALKDSLFAFASRRIEPNTEPTDREGAPKSMAESMAGVLKIYQGMATKNIEKNQRELLEELELACIPAGDSGISKVLECLDRRIADLREEEQRHAQKTAEMRAGLSAETDEKKRNFMATIGLMIDGAEMSARVTAAHFEKVQTQFRLISKRNPEQHHLENLRATIKRLEHESLDAGDA